MNISSIKEIGSGANSRVVLITCKDGKKYAGKFYFTYPRMKAEFSSLNFLWNKGIRCIPQPIYKDQKNYFALYEYIEGRKIKTAEVTREEISRACQFLSRLYKLKGEDEARKLPPAAEACFSVKEIVENIKTRFNSLISLPKKEKINLPLFEFLSKEFTLAFEEIVVWGKQNLKKQGISYAVEIDQECRTLSPSDFGFHNAIKRENGEIIFLDFEYFGWDDPAKLISDFLLHPKMKIKKKFKKIFVKKMLSAFRDDETLSERFKIVFPLFGLKWCLIMLNEFVPEHYQRRKFAARKKIKKEEILNKQLGKAKKMLEFVKENYQSFLYKVGVA